MVFSHIFHHLLKPGTLCIFPGKPFVFIYKDLCFCAARDIGADILHTHPDLIFHTFPSGAPSGFSAVYGDQHSRYRICSLSICKVISSSLL